MLFFLLVYGSNEYMFTFLSGMVGVWQHLVRDNPPTHVVINIIGPATGLSCATKESSRTHPPSSQSATWRGWTRLWRDVGIPETMCSGSAEGLYLLFTSNPPDHSFPSPCLNLTYLRPMQKMPRRKPRRVLHLAAHGVHAGNIEHFQARR